MTLNKIVAYVFGISVAGVLSHAWEKLPEDWKGLAGILVIIVAVEAGASFHKWISQ